MKTLLCVVAFASCFLGLTHALANGQEASAVVEWHVHLLISNTVNPTQVSIGSGALISRTHVLTVALNIANFNTWLGGVGDINRNSLTYHRSTGAIIHEHYNPLNSDNNIGIIFFGNGIEGANISPIRLPPFGFDLPIVGEAGSLSGFGFTSSDLSVQTDVLQIGTQTVLTQSICQQEFPALGAALNNLFCAINVLTQVTPCGGEQGAGFASSDGTNIVLTGLFAVTPNLCETPAATTFYTKVSNYRSWILLLIGQ